MINVEMNLDFRIGVTDFSHGFTEMNTDYFRKLNKKTPDILIGEGIKAEDFMHIDGWKTINQYATIIELRHYDFE